MPSASGTAARIHRDGEEITWRATGTQTDVTLTAFVRGYRADELVGNIAQGDREVHLAGLDLEGYPAPRRNDTLVIGGRTVTAQSVETRRWRGATIVHVVQVRG